MPNALIRAGQDQWLNTWQNRQRQKNPNWNASWAPKAGWRHRFTQNSQVGAPTPPGFGPNDPGAAPPPPPPPPPPPAAPAWTPGFNTLAPTGVPEGGWGGGAIQHETAPAAPPPPVYPAYDGPPRETNVPGYAPGVEPPRPWENQPLTGKAGQDQWLKGWHQRQRGKSGYNASWAPAFGWRGRFNAGGANAMMEY